MIIEFSITNFYSYKDEVTFSMVANGSNECNENYVVKDDRRILKTACIYGANASGKTNLFKVLTNVILMIRNSKIVDPNLDLPIEPFRFDEKSKNSPSKFEIKFIHDDVRYVYGFEADKKKIYEEYLYYYPNGREALIFDRNREKNEYPREDKKILEDISKKTPANRLFLPSAAFWNHSKSIKAFEFFNKTINTIDSINELQNISMKRFYDAQKNGNNELKKFALKYLQDADLNIEDFTVFESEIPNEILAALPDIFKNNMGEKPKGYGVNFKHKCSNELLSFDEESNGTQILFNFIPFLMDTLSNESVLVIDELDRSLHPFIVEMIVNIFNSNKFNKGNAQLIFNTHDTNLLDLNNLRRDQIWFTEKDNITGISDLYSLSDFKMKQGEKYGSSYLIGKYGAIPFINNKFILDREE